MENSFERSVEALAKFLQLADAEDVEGIQNLFKEYGQPVPTSEEVAEFIKAYKRGEVLDAAKE